MATLLQPPIDPDQAPTARELADRYVARLAELNTEVATTLGTHPGDDRVPDLSPDGQSALDDLAQAALTALPAARIVAPAGSAAAPYYTRPLSIYQTTIGSVSATTDGRALYAERLMDELGHLTSPGARLGYLDAQQMRAVRVVLDIGMHLRLRVPDDSPQFPGETWTPEVARGFFGAHCGRSAPFLDSEIVRYLGWPRAGDHLQARRAGVAHGPGGGPGEPRPRVRPGRVAREGAVTGRAGVDRPGRRAIRPVATNGPTARGGAAPSGRTTP